MFKRTIFIALFSATSLITLGLVKAEKRNGANTVDTPPFVLPTTTQSLFVSSSAAFFIAQAPSSLTSPVTRILPTLSPTTSGKQEQPSPSLNTITLSSPRIIYDDTRWPTDSHVLASAFGPRLMASENYRYDFHRGIDIPGKGGVDKVYAIADGEIFKTYEEGDPDNPYQEGGTTIVLRHTADKPIPFHGKTFATYYSVYMHLDKFLVEKINNKSPYPKITKGAAIGIVGQTGATKFDHLHFEIRIGTHCSKKYQHSHPTSNCASVLSEPTDPHVNPFLLLPYANKHIPSIMLMQQTPLHVRITLPREETDFNGIRIIRPEGTKEINFNTRTGINLSIDNDNADGITAIPAVFNGRTTQYQIDFKLAASTTINALEAFDIWGNMVRVSL